MIVINLIEAIKEDIHQILTLNEKELIVKENYEEATKKWASDFAWSRKLRWKLFYIDHEAVLVLT